MELKQAFETVMESAALMALATSVEDTPNVRIITFGYDKADPRKVYFTTFKDCNKVAEFAKNDSVALMPLPAGPQDPAQVRIFGRVKPSAKPLDEVVALILPKSPSDAETLKNGGPMLAIYEVEFDEAFLTVGMEPPQALKL